DRYCQLTHLEQVPGDCLGLAALLGAESCPRTLSIDESENGHVKFLGQLHQPQCLPIAFRVRHAKVAAKLLFRVAATLMADHHHGVVVETRPAADNRGVIAERAVAVELDKIRECELDIISSERPLR